MAYLVFGPLPASVTTPAMNKLVHEVLEAQENAWVKGLSRTIEKNRLMLRHTINVEEDLLSTHISCFNDATLVKLAKQQNFPRGFVLFIDIGKKELRGLGSFYPKFANDQRQQSMDDVYNKDVSRLSFYLKYSGSLGITTLFLHRGRVCYTVSSKNSCDAVGRPEDVGKRTLFPKKGHEVLQTYIDESGGTLMEDLYEAGVRTVGSENFYDDDVSHGYAYNRSGMVVTALCRVDLADTKANPLNYFSPPELYETCKRVGLPVDKPMTLTDPAKMQALVRVIGTHRNYLTLTLLLQLLAESGLELETVHAEYVKGDIIEGFVVRRWARRGGEEVELPSVKWKCWCYQMVTQCLRPFLTKEAGKGLDYRQDLRPLRNAEGVVHPRFEEMMERAVKHWCVFPRGSDAAVVRQKVVARWLLYRAVEASPCSDRDITFNAEKHVEAYWAHLARVAVNDFSEQMQKVGWDLAQFCPTAPTLDAVAAQAGCGGDARHAGRVVPLRRYAEGDRVLLVPVGVPLMGKSSTLRAIARLANGSVFHTTQDDHSGFRTFASAVKRAMAAAEEAEEGSGAPFIFVADRNNHTAHLRGCVLEELGRRKGGKEGEGDARTPLVVYVNFLGVWDAAGEREVSVAHEDTVDEVMAVARARLAERGEGHPSLNDPSTAERVVERFLSEFEAVEEDEAAGKGRAVLNVPIDLSLPEKVRWLCGALREEVGVPAPDATAAEVEAACAAVKADEQAAAAAQRVYMDSVEFDAGETYRMEQLAVSLGVKPQKNELHTTLAYYAEEADPEALRSGIRPHLGKPVRVLIDRLVVSKKAAAFGLTFDPNPPPFPLVPLKHYHVTLAQGHGIKAFHSNIILEKAAAREAGREPTYVRNLKPEEGGAAADGEKVEEDEEEEEVITVHRIDPPVSVTGVVSRRYEKVKDDAAAADGGAAPKKGKGGRGGGRGKKKKRG